MNNACKHAVKMHDFSRLKKKMGNIEKKKTCFFFHEETRGSQPDNDTQFQVKKKKS